ncbi:MAG: AAA family ATPase [Alphaproteobacteria bacterium]
MNQISFPLAPSENQICFGQAQAEHVFETALAKGKLAHGWLLLGPQGVGKRTFAYRLIRLLASGAPSFDALDALPGHLPLFQKITANTFGDLLVLEPEERGKGIPVETARQINAFLQRTATEGPWRILLIDGLDWMNRHAANALLKSLEEPPPGVIFFLLAENLGNVLPTLRSRCQTLRLSPLPTSELKACLSAKMPHLSDEATATILEWSKGCFGKAFFWIQEDRWKKIPTFLNLLEKATLPESHPDFSPPITPEKLAFLLQEPLLFWGELLMEWLEKQTVQAVREKGTLPFSIPDIKQFLADAQQFHLDPGHTWACLFKLLRPQANKPVFKSAGGR